MRNSLDRVRGDEPATEAQISAMAAKAFGQGVILFLREDLKLRVPDGARAVTEGEAKRLHWEKR